MVRDKFKRDIASVMINREAIGKQLRAARKAEGLTLREAAKRAEISFQMIAKVEKEADINPSLDMLEAIASAVKAEHAGCEWANRQTAPTPQRGGVAAT